MAGDAAAPPAPAAFSFETVRQRAAASAAQAYRNPVNNIPDYLKKLSYDEFQMIRFIRGAGPWKGENLRFSFEFFHPGFLYQDEVLMHLVENGEVKDYQFDPKLFEYGTNHFPEPLPKTLHFPGFRILYPVNLPTKQDEVASFVGASYFRLLGKGQRYGVSARALAIDTAEPTGEEFPRFTEFWLESPPRRQLRSSSMVSWTASVRRVPINSSSLLAT